MNANNGSPPSEVSALMRELEGCDLYLDGEKADQETQDTTKAEAFKGMRAYCNSERERFRALFLAASDRGIYPGFDDPDDWGDPIPALDAEGNIIDLTPEARAQAQGAVTRVSAEHDVKHTLRHHPWCGHCHTNLAEINRGEVINWHAVAPEDAELAAICAAQGIDTPERWPTAFETAREALVKRAAAYLAISPEPVDVYLAEQDSQEASIDDLDLAWERMKRRSAQEAAEGALLVGLAPSSAVEPKPSNFDALAELEIDTQLQKLRIRNEAKRRFDAERRPILPPFDAGSLAEVLARPPEPTARIESLIPWEGSTLISAQKKTGKTTLTLNLARCLITGEDFLGRFAVQPVEGKVALLNFEVSAAQIARWADDVQVDRDRLVLVNLRGRGNPLADLEDRERLAAYLRERNVESLIVDPFGRAYSGVSQNDNGEVGQWLVGLDQFGRAEVGARDVILTAHAGWTGEHARGASALEDWPDSIITMTKSEETGERFLSALGRDVELEEDRLTFDSRSRLLTLSGAGSRQAAKTASKLDDLAVLAVAAIRSEQGISGRRVAEIVRGFDDAPHQFRTGDLSAACKKLEQNGMIRTEVGPRRATLHFLAEKNPGAENA